MLEGILSVDVKENPTKMENNIIERNLYAFNDTMFGKPYDFSVFLRDTKNEIQGGVILQLRPKLKLLYIDFIWIAPEFRNKGFGTKIVNVAEKIAKEKGCKTSEVETLSFQAEAFYQKLGYTRFGMVEKYMGNFDYIFMRKNLEI